MKIEIGLSLLLIRLLHLCHGDITIDTEDGNNIVNSQQSRQNDKESCEDKNIESNSARSTKEFSSDEIENKCPNEKSPEILLSRRRRALKFPEGSNFVASIPDISDLMTNSLVKGLLIGLPLGWNMLMEMDSIFKSPGLQDLVRYQLRRHLLHKRQRRELWGGIEEIFNTHGLNGENCLLRTMCEVKYLLEPKNTIFVHDMLRVLLTVPEGSGYKIRYRKASEEKDCSLYEGENKCPFSALKILLSSNRII